MQLFPEWNWTEPTPMKVSRNYTSITFSRSLFYFQCRSGKEYIQQSDSLVLMFLKHPESGSLFYLQPRFFLIPRNWRKKSQTCQNSPRLRSEFLQDSDLRDNPFSLNFEYQPSFPLFLYVTCILSVINSLKLQHNETSRLIVVLQN